MFNQQILFGSAPLLELFFSRQCAVNIRSLLEIDKFVDVIFPGKTICQSVAVLVEPFGEIAGNTDVYNRIIPV